MKFQQENVKGRVYHYGILGKIEDLDMDALNKLGRVVILTPEDIFGYWFLRTTLQKTTIKEASRQPGRLFSVSAWQITQQNRAKSHNETAANRQINSAIIFADTGNKSAVEGFGRVGEFL